MSEDDIATELLATTREIRDLERELRCLDAKRNRLLDNAERLGADMRRFFEVDLLIDAGVSPTQNLDSWPDAKELSAVLDDMVTAADRLRRARHRQQQLSI